MLAGRKQTAIVFFLDETFEELEFDATSTVLEAVEYLAGVIKLQSYQTFTLYECRKVRGSQPGLVRWPVTTSLHGLYASRLHSSRSITVRSVPTGIFPCSCVGKGTCLGVIEAPELPS